MCWINSNIANWPLYQWERPNHCQKYQRKKATAGYYRHIPVRLLVSPIRESSKIFTCIPDFLGWKKVPLEIELNSIRTQQEPAKFWIFDSSTRASNYSFGPSKFLERVSLMQFGWCRNIALTVIFVPTLSYVNIAKCSNCLLGSRPQILSQLWGLEYVIYRCLRRYYMCWFGEKLLNFI